MTVRRQVEIPEVKAREAPPERIVVLLTHALGNCLHATPALRSLRRTFPTASITLVGDPYTSGLFLHSPEIDRVITVGQRPSDLIRSLPALVSVSRPDLLIDMRTSPRTFPQALIVGGRRRIGIESRRSFIYTDVVPRYPEERLVMYEAAQLLKPLGITLEQEDRWLRLEVTAEERNAARRLLANRGVDLARPYALLQLTVGKDQVRGAHRRWPAEKFAALSDWLQREARLQVVVTSQRADEEMLVAVRALVQEPFVDLSGQTDLRTLIGIVEGASLYTGYDTGPMHLAAALDVPIAAIFEVPAVRETFTPITHAPYRMIPGGPLCDGPCCAEPESGRDWCLRSLEVDDVAESVRQVLMEAGGRLGQFKEFPPASSG